MPDDNKLNEQIAQARKERERRDNGYRARAMKLFPPVCAHCGREFSGRRLSELTVHHKDHNHDNNPADGSNWELLCEYCHENEHARDDVASAYAEPPGTDSPAASTYKPFEGLADLLKKSQK